MSPILLVVLFVVSAVLGYVIIRNIPALLHTPLMSGMNALSGITVLGAIIAAFEARGGLALILALAAAVLAMVNVAGGFALTHKMLSRFVKKGEKKEDE
jgi:NAD(P) transhydrogenase subunit alpha